MTNNGDKKEQQQHIALLTKATIQNGLGGPGQQSTG
jgi:hypothetical protein